MEDQTDAKIFSSFFRSSTAEEKVISSKIPICAKYDDFYNINHRNRGVALIFNHVNFEDTYYSRREGSDLDRDRLEKVLNKLEFEIRIYNDLSYAEISHVLNKVSDEDHSHNDCILVCVRSHGNTGKLYARDMAYPSDKKVFIAVSDEDHTHNDCILVCVMSHGNTGKIYARDMAYPSDKLWEPFLGDKCITLNGKPKMFFIQACRGNQIDDGATVKNKEQTDSSSKELTYQIPAMADILVMYGTYTGYYSWRSPSKGSWFIQSLCDIFEKYGSEKDLLSMLTLVNRKVAIDFESAVPLNSKMHKKKQVCTIISMLTRLMAFPIKNNLN